MTSFGQRGLPSRELSNHKSLLPVSDRSFSGVRSRRNLFHPWFDVTGDIVAIEMSNPRHAPDSFLIASFGRYVQQVVNVEEQVEASGIR